MVPCTADKDVTWKVHGESVPALYPLLHLWECVCSCVCMRVCEYIGHVEPQWNASKPKYLCMNYIKLSRFFLICVSCRNMQNSQQQSNVSPQVKTHRHQGLTMLRVSKLMSLCLIKSATMRCCAVCYCEDGWEWSWMLIHKWAQILYSSILCRKKKKQHPESRERQTVNTDAQFMAVLKVSASLNRFCMFPQITFSIDFWNISFLY